MAPVEADRGLFLETLMRRLLVAALLILMGSSGRAADTVVVVLDASGSMDEMVTMKTGEKLEKMKVAKLALARTLLSLPEDTQVGILVFSASNLSAQDEWVYPIGKINKVRLAEAIQKPTPGGGTPLGEYIKKGADALLEQRDKNRGYGTYTQVVVTDGVATDGSLVEQNVPLVMARGIRLNVIGLAVAPDNFLANRVSSYQSADDLETLTTAVKRAVAEVPTGKDGKIDPAWFSEIEPLPTAVVSAALTALNTTIAQNQPIGDQPKVITQVDDQGNATQVPNPAVNAQAAPAGGGLGFFGIVGIILLVVLALVIGGAILSR
jgi:hypothetical protein